MTIIDRIEEDLKDKNSSLSKLIQEEECIKKMLNEEAERKNNELKKELDIHEGKYVDKSIFPKK